MKKKITIELEQEEYDFIKKIVKQQNKECGTKYSISRSIYQLLYLSEWIN